MKNTKVSYMYRDASNYKECNSVVLQGELTPKQIAEIMNRCYDGNGFIPSQVGLDDLQDSLQGLDSEDYGDDHCWHELEEQDVTIVDKAPTIKMTAQEFYKRFIKVEWKEFEVGHIVTDNYQGKKEASAR